MRALVSVCVIGTACLFSLSGCAKPDPYPFTVAVTCGTQYVLNIPLALGSCIFRSGLVINSGDETFVFRVGPGGLSGPFDQASRTERGLELALHKNFKIFTANDSPNMVLGITVYDKTNKVVFQQYAGQYEAIQFQN